MSTYHYYNDFGGLDSSFWSVFLPVLMVILLFALIFFLAVYILQGIGLYKMTRNAGIPNPWLAFIPIGNQYLIGLLAERAASVSGGRRMRFSMILLWGSVGITLASVPLSMTGILAPLVVLAGIALNVLFYMALYYIFKDYSPQNAVLFLVLSILLGISWVFLFALRNRVPVSVAGFYPQGQPRYEPYPPAGSYGPAGPTYYDAANGQNNGQNGPTDPNGPSGL